MSVSWKRSIKRPSASWKYVARYLCSVGGVHCLDQCFLINIFIGLETSVDTREEEVFEVYWLLQSVQGSTKLGHVLIV